MSFSFTWVSHPAFRCLPSMCKEKTITETIHDGKPIMRDQDGNLVVIINNKDEYGDGWSSDMSVFKDITKEQRYFLATHPSLVRIVAEYYETHKRDKVKLIEIIQHNFPLLDQDKIKSFINFHTEHLYLGFIPPHSKFVIKFSGSNEIIVLYKEEDFYNS